MLQRSVAVQVYAAAGGGGGDGGEGRLVGGSQEVVPQRLFTLQEVCVGVGGRAGELVAQLRSPCCRVGLTHC